MSVPADRKEQIYRAAARLFSEEGYRATSMRDIAGALDMKAGSLYSHIRGKEDLLWEIVSRVADEFDAALAEVRGAPLAPAAKLRRALEAYTAVVARNLEFATVLFQDWRHLPADRRAAIALRRDAVEGVFREIVAQGVQAGVFDPSLNVKLTTVLALSGANWLPNWYRPQGALSPTEVADAFADLLLRGVERREE
ncbi:TetR/AcrR family transcriptional regulator [Deinococcus peraridilitoris]|uniref:Transcriptional regulator n=1 Tax=Deinococcus peraridilitoris (strain DSM 19664 / LMG 22246 / CIP 109416 / KR-200) TaxID=937777 RepID=K9ZZM4_DEIPD|nr:TetR/AcrR family transcriptional regulator [Deinococcus peraridilitoris]AFZ66392.1 transcriptional regulator [Deinococcus peraridilitoris DSM 19664]